MEEMQVVQTLPIAYATLKFVHILLFVYWLGGDAGVFYSSTFVTNDGLSRDAAADGVQDLRQPRHAAALLPGADADGRRRARRVRRLRASAVADHRDRRARPIWVWVVHTIHVKEGTEFGTELATLDYQFRLFMIFAILASVAYHWTPARCSPYPWLAAKLLIFAFLIFCGFMIRRKLPPFIEGFRVLASKGATPDSDRLMHDGIMACRPYVWAIWIGVALSAWLGIWKPGMGS
jgi:hypothetical protein